MGGMTIEAPKARASRRQRHRVAWGMGRNVRSPADYGVWGRIMSFPSGIRGGAPAAVAFSAYFRRQNASGSEKVNDSLAQSIRKNWHFYIKKYASLFFKFCSANSTMKKVVETVTIVTYKVALHNHSHARLMALSGSTRVSRYQKGKTNLGPSLQNILRFIS